MQIYKYSAKPEIIVHCVKFLDYEKAIPHSHRCPTF